MKNKIYCIVGDHCHYTGEYRDTVNSLCNLKYSVPESHLKMAYLFRRKH